MTGSQYKRKYLSGCVHEILALCRIHKIFFQKYHEKAEIQSFPTMYKIQLKNLFKMLKLAVFNSSKYSFNKKSRVLNRATLSSHNSYSRSPNLEN